MNISGRAFSGFIPAHGGGGRPFRHRFKRVLVYPRIRGGAPNSSVLAISFGFIPAHGERGGWVASY